MVERNEKERTNRVRRILDSKRQTPEYQRIDIEPQEGGKSRLHDEFGIPKIQKLQKKEVQPLKGLSNKPIAIKAVAKENIPVMIGHHGMNRQILKSKAKQQVEDEDDKFYPPKSNFVSVGQQEHAWHDESVTGLPTVDNNEIMDTENLQGIDPLLDTELSQVCQYFNKYLTHITEGVVSQLDDVEDLDDLSKLHKNVLSNTGILGKLLRQFNKVPPNDKEGVGYIVNNFIEDMNEKFKTKQDEFVQEEEESKAEEEEYDKAHEDDEDKKAFEDTDTVEETGDSEIGDSEIGDSETGDSETGVNLQSLSEIIQDGQYGILVQGSLVSVANSLVSAKQMLTTLVLNKNVDISTITLIKRIPIDFGIIVDG